MEITLFCPESGSKAKKKREVPFKRLHLVKRDADSGQYLTKGHISVWTRVRYTRAEKGNSGQKKLLLNTLIPLLYFTIVE